MDEAEASILHRLGRSLNPGMLSGITFSTWCALLWENRFRVHPAYLPRALSITVSSVANSVAGFWEQRRYGAEWQSLVPEPPIMVTGIARSGTTFLHNLFGMHPSLAYPTILEARYPLSFVTLGQVVGVLSKLLLGKKRAQDGVSFGPDEPAEEISALIALGVKTPLIIDAFPNNPRRKLHHLQSFQMGEERQQAFVDALQWFSRKLTWKHGKRLVFKNPGYVKRLPAVLKAFPEAKIVFIHRHPFETINSGLRAYDVVSAHRRLQKTKPVPPENTVRRGGRAIRQYLQDRDRVPKGNLAEVAYAELVADPVAVMEDVYRRLGLPEFENGLPALRAHVEGLRTYRKNRYPDLPDHLRAIAVEEFPEWFNTWGYSV